MDSAPRGMLFPSLPNMVAGKHASPVRRMAPYSRNPSIHTGPDTNVMANPPSPPSTPQHIEKSGSMPLDVWRMTGIPSDARHRIRFLEAECDSLRREREKMLLERYRAQIDADAARRILAAERNFTAAERHALDAEREVFSAKEKALTRQLVEEAGRARKADDAVKKAQADVTWLKEQHEEASRTFENLLVDIANGLGISQ